MRVTKVLGIHIVLNPFGCFWDSWGKFRRLFSCKMLNFHVSFVALCFGVNNLIVVYKQTGYYEVSAAEIIWTKCCSSNQ